MRRPFVSVISIRVSSASREGRSSGVSRGLSISGGMKPHQAPGARRSESQYSRHQIARSDCETHTGVSSPNPAGSCAGSLRRSGYCLSLASAYDARSHRRQRSRWMKQLERMP